MTPKHQQLKDVLSNIKDVYMSPSSLSTLLDFERVLSELDLYAFDHWKQGELVEGPSREKYFVTCKFMWPYKYMPDPRGGERLLGYDCEVSYEKSKLVYPIKIESEEDFQVNTKLAKVQETKVWIVTITMPRSLITDIQQGALDLEKETLDIEEIEQAYQDGTTDSEDQGTEAAGEPVPEEPVPEELPK